MRSSLVVRAIFNLTALLFGLKLVSGTSTIPTTSTTVIGPSTVLVAGYLKTDGVFTPYVAGQSSIDAALSRESARLAAVTSAVAQAYTDRVESLVASATSQVETASTETLTSSSVSTEMLTSSSVSTETPTSSSVATETPTSSSAGSSTHMTGFTTLP